MGKSPQFAKNGRKPKKTYGNGFNYLLQNGLFNSKHIFY